MTKITGAVVEAQLFLNRNLDHATVIRMTDPKGELAAVVAKAMKVEVDYRKAEADFETASWPNAIFRARRLAKLGVARFRYQNEAKQIILELLEAHESAGENAVAVERIGRQFRIIPRREIGNLIDIAYGTVKVFLKVFKPCDDLVSDLGQPLAQFG